MVSAWEQRHARPQTLALSSASLQSCCITFKSPNLLAVQRERFRQQIFWVTDFSNRPGAGSLWGCTPEACWVDRSGEMPATCHRSHPRQAVALSRPGWLGGGKAGAAADPRLWVRNSAGPELATLSNWWPWLPAGGLVQCLGLCVVCLLGQFPGLYPPPSWHCLQGGRS